jgi:PAS domain S-box-containing protein
MLLGAYAALLTILAVAMVINPDLSYFWTPMMIPVFLAAIFYRRRTYLYLFGLFTTYSAVVIAISARDKLDSYRVTAIFLVAVVVASETLFRLIQAREKARAELSASESRFRSLSTMAPVGIFETDAEGNCTYTNARWETITELTGLESQGAGWTSAIHPDDRTAVLAGWADCLQRGEEFDRTFRVARRTGNLRWVRMVSTAIVNRSPGVSMSRVGTIEDITDLKHLTDDLEARVEQRTLDLQFAIQRQEEEILERKRVEEALRQSEERFAKAFYSTPLAIAITSLKDGRFVDVNERFLQQNGYTREEVIGRTAADLDMWVRFDLRTELIKTVMDKGAVYDVEAQFLSWGGTTRDILISMVKITLNGESCILVIGVDITERKRMEQQISENAATQTSLLGQLMNAQEAERKRLSMEIHDGPLQSLGVSLLAVDRAVRRRQRQEHEMVDHELDYLRSTLSDTVEEVRAILADLSLEVLGSYGIDAALRTHVERFSEATGLLVKLDTASHDKLPSDLELLLYRLAQEGLANVRKHAHAQHVSVDLLEQDGEMLLIISDDGRGFDVESTMSAHRDGEGLGLKSMRQRVQAAGGDLSIESAPAVGKGTTLTFRSPVNGALVPSQTASLGR